MRGLIKQPPSSLAFSPAHPPPSPSSLQGISPPSSTLAVEGSSALAPAVCQLCHSPFHPRWASPLAPRIRARMRVNSPADTSTTLFSLLVNYMSLIVRYPLHRTATFSVLFSPPSFFSHSSAECDLEYVPRFSRFFFRASTKLNGKKFEN